MISVIIATLGEKDISGLILSLKKQLNTIDEIIVEIDLENNVSRVRNKGWKRAKGKIIVFLDDDVIISDNFIKQGLKDFVNYDFGQSKVIGGIVNAKDKFTGTVMWFKRTVLKRVGGFNEQFSFYNEDIDIYLRCIKMGFRYGYLESPVWHPKSGGFEKLIKGNELLKQEHPKFYPKLIKEIR